MLYELNSRRPEDGGFETSAAQYTNSLLLLILSITQYNRFLSVLFPTVLVAAGELSATQSRQGSGRVPYNKTLLFCLCLWSHGFILVGLHSLLSSILEILVHRTTKPHDKSRRERRDIN
jgi:hypothetical protein